MSIQLMLAHEDGTQALSEEGIPEKGAIDAAEKPAPEGILSYRDDGADPNDLTAQRWGIVIPATPEGKRLAQVIAPLTALRKEQQGKDVRVLEAPVGMSAEQTGKWWETVYNAESTKNRVIDRPRYLLILGDPTQIPWEAQERMATAAFVGRLSFPKDEDYEAYVTKVLAYERAASKNQQKVHSTFFTVSDGTAATGAGNRGLMKPTLEALRIGLKEGDFQTADIAHLGADPLGPPVSPEEFLRSVESRDPRMLFTISHGLGTNAETSDEVRQRIQGAMSFGQGKKITGDDIANRVFLPGGAWFFFACFSIGTPAETSYRHWLQAMKDAGLGVRQSDIEFVLAALRKKQPLVASLPQKALANPDGPLAVMGHVDLAWTFSFQDAAKQWRSSRFHNVFNGLVKHYRIGNAFFDLQRALVDTNSALTDMFDTEARAKADDEVLEDAAQRPAQKASLWMLRQDLYAYVLLGDPAARVMTSTTPEETRTKVPTIVTTSTDGTNASSTEDKPPVATTNTSAPTFADTASAQKNNLARIDPERIEAAVFAPVGKDVLDALAKHFGVERSDLDAWITTYKQGGLAAVRGKNIT